MAKAGTQLKIEPPRDYVLTRDLCSYGYFLLAPNHWDPANRTFRATLDLAADPRFRKTQRSALNRGGGAPSAVTVHIRQQGDRGDRAARPGAALVVNVDRPLARDEANILRDMLARMLRLDEDHDVIAEFHALDPRWALATRQTGSGWPAAPRRERKPARSGGPPMNTSVFCPDGRGRLMRSPTFFEDVIKTVTSCNVTWPSTIIMNARLCEVLGAGSASGLHAFPTPARLARATPAVLRARCRVGYRDARILELSRMFAEAQSRESRGRVHDRAKGHVDPGWLASPDTPDDDVFDALLEWPGIGPYAAANILQLLGRYSRLPLDSESLRHARTVLGWKGTPRRLMKRLHRHFEPFGRHKFRAYWFELWHYYEAKRGPAHTWERETTGKTFTASQF